ncbi:hypothetical protein PHLCEN_2v3530 [Hermanssonia centrifuga]|uniref:Uncharacterized protein n=1 Tax=Hermanssonia centrifuga TaxID=98765 RepID=A0A2R6QEW2_9APHY|nr:hypothetical protein PHLCEN_2v3530 [Hermanssonia centrifuga]
MSRFEVFVGAPTTQDLKQTNKSPHRWLTVSSTPKPATFFALPPATLEAASLRISRLYENIIFDGLGSEEEKECEEPSRDVERRPDTQGKILFMYCQAAVHSLMHGAATPEQSTLISWPPTGRDVEESHIEGGRDISFLRPTASLSRLRSQFQTQDTQETGSYDYSDASSIGHFPVFHFTLHNLTSLSTLQNKNGRNPVQRFQPNTSSPKLTVLAAVLEIEGPDTIRIKKGTDAGKDVSISKLIIGDDEGMVGKLTAWRDVAERWGGCYPDRDSPSIKRGDVVLFQSSLRLRTQSQFGHLLTASSAFDRHCCLQRQRLGYLRYKQCALAHSLTEPSLQDGDMLPNYAK